MRERDPGKIHTMSLWLQSAIWDLDSRSYKHFREQLIPCAPIPIPGCMMKEFEFGERYCRDPQDDPLFPIRFLWLLEGLEHRNFSLPMLGRSRYHPEILLFDFWEQAVADPSFREELESAGFKFNFEDKAIAMSAGWIFIGDHFADDLFEVESVLNTKFLFPDAETGELRPVFNALRKVMG
jgi:hypothetical protein